MNATTQVHKPSIPVTFILKVFFLVLLIISKIYFESEVNASILLPQIQKGLLIFLISSTILSILRFLLILIYNKKNANRHVRGNFVLGVNRLTAILNAVFAVIALMTILGIDPRDFITSITIVAMAIAVIFRDYITNMISGMIVMFSDQLSVGDRIKVGDFKGRIVDITFANIVLQDEEDDIIMVPNNNVFTTTFMNLSAHQSSLFNVKFELPLLVSLHIDELEKTLRESLLGHPNLKVTQEELVLKVMEIGKDFVRYKLDLYAISNSNRLHKKLENEILKEVLKFEAKFIKSSSL
ncbi:mechanosensitive ion channel family protein [Sphingobacterium sp. HJSM2_6]|uniref:mechanosensitive ion channel family protein n=1 Tax=Sphingobacterium sp. HJSM2_6 TaxID=3366264 RepID=UPI003BCC5237